MKIHHFARLVLFAAAFVVIAIARASRAESVFVKEIAPGHQLEVKKTEIPYVPPPKASEAKQPERFPERTPPRRYRYDAFVLERDKDPRKIWSKEFLLLDLGGIRNKFVFLDAVLSETNIFFLYKERIDTFVEQIVLNGTSKTNLLPRVMRDDRAGLEVHIVLSARFVQETNAIPAVECTYPYDKKGLWVFESGAWVEKKPPKPPNESSKPPRP